MAFDLEYVQVECTHRIHDIKIQEAVDRALTLQADNAVYGEDYYGDEEYGAAVFDMNSTHGAYGTFLTQPNGTVSAVLDIGMTPGDSPRVFYRAPGTYLRVEVPRYSHNTYVYETAIDTSLTFGEEVVFGGVAEGHDLDGDVQENWLIDYSAETITINNYKNTYDWYLDISVPKDDCPMCHGSGVKNDITFGVTGRANIVTDTSKIIQEVMKSMLTEKGKNQDFPAYGSILKYLLGTKYALSGFTVRQEVFEQLQALRRKQLVHASAKPDFYTPYEVINELQGVTIAPQTDPRSLKLEVKIQTLALDRVSTKPIKVTI